MSSIDQFKAFVRKHPGLKQEVHSGKKTWQQIYEDWVLFGEEDEGWRQYAQGNQTLSGNQALTSQEGQEFLKNALNYVKKLNPDDLTKYINNFQKILGLMQMFNGGNNRGPQRMMNRPPRRIDPLFRRYDDYYD